MFRQQLLYSHSLYVYCGQVNVEPLGPRYNLRSATSINCSVESIMLGLTQKPNLNFLSLSHKPTCTVCQITLPGIFELINIKRCTFNNFDIVGNTTARRKHEWDARTRLCIHDHIRRSWVGAFHPYRNVCTTTKITRICCGHFISSNTLESIPGIIFDVARIADGFITTR